MKLKIRSYKGFKIEIWSDSELILEKFMDHLVTKKINKFPLILPNGRKFFKEKITASKLYRKKKDKLYLPYGFIEYLGIFIAQLMQSYPKLELDFNIEKFPSVQLNDKWKQIFSNHPKGPARGQMQMDDFSRLLKSNIGLAELFVSYGKGELILSIADHLKEQKTLLLIPDNKLIEDLLERSKRYDIDCANGDWSKNINIINPVPFLRSKAFNDKAKNWITQVKNILTDESHHLSADSYEKLFEQVDNLERSYGLSGSMDVEEGLLLSPKDQSLYELGYRSSKIVALAGTVKINRKLKIPVTIKKYNCRIADKEKLSKCDTWQSAIDVSVQDFKFAETVKNIFDNDLDKMFFIPVGKKESGIVLHKNLTSLGLTGIYWDSDILYINDDEIKTDNQLIYLKNYIDKNNPTYFISTRFEGIDLPKLNAIIHLIGVNSRMTIQPAGRSARNEDLLIVLLFDKNSPIICSQMRIRHARCKKEFNIIKEEEITLR